MIDHLQQLVVGNDDQGVDFLAKRRNSLLRLGGPPPALEGERPGYHADGERTQRTGDSGDDARRQFPYPPPSPAVTNTMSAP